MWHWYRAFVWPVVECVCMHVHMCMCVFVCVYVCVCVCVCVMWVTVYNYGEYMVLQLMPQFRV